MLIEDVADQVKIERLIEQNKVDVDDGVDKSVFYQKSRRVKSLGGLTQASSYRDKLERDAFSKDKN